jgi:hypothetical protein
VGDGRGNLYPRLTSIPALLNHEGIPGNVIERIMDQTWEVIDEFGDVEHLADEVELWVAEHAEELAVAIAVQFAVDDYACMQASKTLPMAALIAALVRPMGVYEDGRGNSRRDSQTPESGGENHD